MGKWFVTEYEGGLFRINKSRGVVKVYASGEFSVWHENNEKAAAVTIYVVDRKKVIELTHIGCVPQDVPYLWDSERVHTMLKEMELPDDVVTVVKGLMEATGILEG